jgi:transcriptional regulator with XRE-family HTH domain
MNPLVKARKRYKLSGYSVAKAAGIDRSYYRKIEIGEYVPSVAVAVKIADALEKMTGSNSVTASEVVFMNHKLRAKSKKVA